MHESDYRVTRHRCEPLRGGASRSGTGRSGTGRSGTVRDGVPQGDVIAPVLFTPSVGARAGERGVHTLHLIIRQ